MTIDLNLIKHVVIVIMENRSFDHLLGYLSLPDWKEGRPQPSEGLKVDQAWLNSFANSYKGSKFTPFQLKDPYDNMDADPPHERDPIALQMGIPANGYFPMDGFVANYATAPGAKSLSANQPPPVMGHFIEAAVPVTHFFAENFAICDHWHASLPAGTQPNRLMAMSGYTLIDVNHDVLPKHDLVYDWLTRNNIRWRVYHQDLPFFSMMPHVIPDILFGDHFRDFKQLFEDVQNEAPNEFPEVIFIEPRYTDAPHLHDNQHVSSDDHAPSAVKGGQEFLLEVYRAITREPRVWNETAIIVTYDEHGGFFDHVSPPAIPAAPPPEAKYTQGFNTLGVRVPAFIISPFVQPKTVISDVLDHTSILKFIGERFSKSGKYSDVVDNRPVASFSKVFEVTSPGISPVIPSLDDYLARQVASVGFIPGQNPSTPMQNSFQVALDGIRNNVERPPEKFADLLTHFPAKKEAAA